jgi:hypothetical protein
MGWLGVLNRPPGIPPSAVLASLLQFNILRRIGKHIPPSEPLSRTKPLCSLRSPVQKPDHALQKRIVLRVLRLFAAIPPSPPNRDCDFISAG